MRAITEVGRGRLSSLQLLPDEATPAVQVAFDAVLADRATQKEILAALNAALQSLGLEISYSALSRWSGEVRRGKVRRPVSKLLPEAEAGIFDRGFRVALVGSMGEEFVRAHERLMKMAVVRPQA